MANSMKYYVHVYRDPNEIMWSRPLYVGKGAGRRADRHWKIGSHNEALQLMLDDYRARGIEPVREIVAKFDNEDDAFAWEKALIAQYGRADLGTGSLANRHDGGRIGPVSPSAEARAKIGAAHRGKSHSQEHRAKIGAASLGRKPMLGKKHNQETLEKMSATRRGMPKTQEHRAKIGAANRGRIVSPETRAKIGAARRRGRLGNTSAFSESDTRPGRQISHSMSSL